ncbi:MAG: hypothetical protein FWG53_10235 [Clostridiales bacterium]|nr:hypothetical protein [Clostridiales bacterium]
MPRKQSKKTGDVFGRLTILEDLGTRKIGKRNVSVRFYLCECSCGNRIEVRCGDLQSGNIKSCGCLKRETHRGAGNPKKPIEVGDKYERLTVLEDLGTREVGRQGARRRFFLCECDCGNKIEIPGNGIGERYKSCGCLRREQCRKLILPGTVFGRLTVLELCDPAERKPSEDVLIYKCQCECGSVIKVAGTSLRTGNTRSCGCINRENFQENIREARSKIFVEGTNIMLISHNRIRADNTSGVRGVSKSRGKWVAAIKFKKKKYYLGSFNDINEAAEVRKEAEERIFGGFLEWYKNRVNFSCEDDPPV